MSREATVREKLDKATLERLYTQVGLSTVQIAERFGTQPSQVRALMIQYGIGRRPRGTQTDYCA